MLTIEANGKDILLFGRNGKQPYIKRITNFNPYFYVEDSNGGYIGIDNKKLKKINLKHPKQVFQEREKYNKTYEADVRYTDRYIIDNFDKIEKEEKRICYLDIETEKVKEGYEDVEKAINPISTIACYDNFDNKYEIFYGNEKKLLNDFIEYIRYKNPDILVAWHGDGFDFPYIINRMKKIKLNPNKLARENGNVYVSDYGTNIYGRVLFDLMDAYKRRISTSQKESWSLDYISKYELGNRGGKLEYEGDLDYLRKTDFEKFKKYNIRDVELMVMLDNTLHIIDFFDEIRRFSFSTFKDVFMTTKMSDHLCLKYAKDNGFVLPTSEEKSKAEYEGGFVRENNPKLYRNVAVLDFKSLYPSIMITFNMSYETVDENGEININNKHKFTNKKKGMIPNIIQPLLKRRVEVKKQMEKTKSKDELHSLDLLQQAIKVIANAFYGVLGSKYFRLYRKEVAESITYTARFLIKKSAEWFEDNNYTVVYGDTDSVFIKFDKFDIDNMINVTKKCNDFLNDYITRFGINKDESIIELELEKIYKTIFFKRKADGTGAKKKYAGRLIWKDGKEMDEVHVMGFESRRSDSPQIGRDFLKRILEMVVYEYPKDDIDDYIEEFKNKIRNEFKVKEIALPKGISKKLSEYGNNMHVRAARVANERHDADIRKGDKIKYVFIKNDTENVIAFKTDGEMWNGYTIDYDNMIRRIVDMKVGPIYRSLDWNYNYTIIEKSKMKKEVPLSKKLQQVGLW